MANLLEGLDTSAKIRGLIAAHQMTQAELGVLLNITRDTVLNHLAENRWDIKELNKIAEHFKIDTKDLI